MKSTCTATHQSVVEGDRPGSKPGTINKSHNVRLAMDGGGYQQRRPNIRKGHLRLQRHPQQQLHLEQPASLHSVAKAKLMPRFTRIQVLSIIKLATMDKLRESGAGGPDDPSAARQRLATEGGGGGGGGGGGTGAGGGAAGGGDGGSSDEYHHQFYNTGRIGRRNALPDILGTHCTTTTADLSTQLGALSTSECTGKASDGSSSSIASGNHGQPPPTTTAT
uniref:Uncharacterized protein n=2 Tax=Anopheles dirus TaxID=7168 RepID=A0A182NL47_9DIPT